MLFGIHVPVRFAWTGKGRERGRSGGLAFAVKVGGELALPPQGTKGTDSVNARGMVPSVAPVGLHIEGQDPVRDEEMHLQPASSEERLWSPPRRRQVSGQTAGLEGLLTDERSHHRDPPLRSALLSPLVPLCDCSLFGVLAVWDGPPEDVPGISL